MDATESLQKIAGWWNTDGLKMANIDAMLISELDRLAADCNMSADECLQQLMVLRVGHEGTEAVRMMVETATELWRNFKPGSKRLKYREASRESRQATRDGLPGDNSAYAIIERNARQHKSVSK